ncbi:S8 family serine peptidase [Agromyces seonyuensis]|uniref:S8 family serine peptidase n=1 Tax=Agromyces seonyuensis TaxID=2662446 RepID=A0A6I4P0R6_9MICO|nr:S8 family serine peptidase [Agromyces seonyuensis]MWB98325.1 S8 family serine peptidase [Agromyces seonyuensis]
MTRGRSDAPRGARARSRGSERRLRRGAGFVAALAAVAGVLTGAAPAHADTVRDAQYWLDGYGYTTAWNTSRGKGVTVAVIDTGVDGSVAELEGVVVGGSDPSGVGAPDGQTPVGSADDKGHGTMVASLLAGRGTGPDSGVLGVAPEAELLSISVAFGADTGSTVSNDDQIAEAVRWAVDQGADVINMSLTRNTLSWPESWDDAFMYAFEHDVVVVAAAGNRAGGTTEVGAPATIPGVLTVGGVDRDQNASFDASSQGITISVAAPSEDLVGVAPGGGYYIWDGTSAATPLVSGLVALVRAAHPELDAGNVINRITETADPKGEQVPSPLYGYGLIDPAEAVNAVVPLVDTDPAAQLAEWIRINRRADSPDSGTPESEEAIVPAPDPPLPQADAGPSILPTPWTLAYITLPLALVAVFGSLAVLIGVGATRDLRRRSQPPPP